MVLNLRIFGSTETFNHQAPGNVLGLGVYNGTFFTCSPQHPWLSQVMCVGSSKILNVIDFPVFTCYLVVIVFFDVVDICAKKQPNPSIS